MSDNFEYSLADDGSMSAARRIFVYMVTGIVSGRDYWSFKTEKLEVGSTRPSISAMQVDNSASGSALRAPRRFIPACAGNAPGC